MLYFQGLQTYNNITSSYTLKNVIFKILQLCINISKCNNSKICNIFNITCPMQ